MAKVYCRLCIYDSKGNLLTCNQRFGYDLAGAVYDAVQEGYRSGRDFHVIELDGQAPKLYWNGVQSHPNVYFNQGVEEFESLTGDSFRTLIAKKLS